MKLKLKILLVAISFTLFVSNGPQAKADDCWYSGNDLYWCDGVGLCGQIEPLGGAAATCAGGTNCTFYASTAFNRCTGEYWCSNMHSANPACFPAGTKISMGDGTYKSIEKVKVGDVVLSYNSKGELVKSNVTRNFIHTNSRLIRVNNLEVTPNHPFLNSKGEYKAIEEIVKDGDLLVKENGEVDDIEKVEAVKGLYTTYNFEVAETHTYIAGGYRVHNKGGSCFPAGTKILTATGQKNIEDVKTGDLVMSYNESEQKQEVKKVTEIESPVRDHMCQIDFVSGKSLQLTEEHPVYSQQGWRSLNPIATIEENTSLRVSKIERGDQILDAFGRYEEIKDYRCWSQLIKTYNLKTIEGNHTFYADGFLVHNKGPSCTTRTNSGTNSCSYWDTVDWGPCDLTTGTQQAIQVLRSKSCTWSCSCQDCGGGCSCSSSCNPGCPPNDPKVRNCDVCGDNMVPEPMRKYWDKRGRCPGITPAYPRPGADDSGWTRPREYQSEDPWDANGLLKSVDQYQCNVNDYTYLELICEECDHGFCGSATCYGPADGAAYACRWKAGNCRDGVVQHDEVCDGDHCNSTCTDWASCGDGEINWPPNRDDKEQCDDGRTCNNASGQLINCTKSTSGCANASDCITRNGDGCDSQCRQENQGNVQEVTPNE